MAYQQEKLLRSMRALTSRRWVVLGTVSLALVLVVSFLILHTPWGKDQVRHALVTAVQDRIGGTFSIDELDYRFWRGEVRLREVAWTSATGMMSGRAREAAIGIHLRSAGTIEIRSPELRVAVSGEAEIAVASLPSSLFGFGWTITDGHLVLEGEDYRLEIEAIEAELDAGDGILEGHLSFGKASLDELELGPARTHARIGPTSAELTQSRLEKGSSSWMTGTIRIASYAPFTAQATLSHAIEGSLVGKLSNAPPLDGVFEGEATIEVEGGRLNGEGILRSSRMTVGASQPVRLQLPWRLSGDILRIENGELSGYGGHARVGLTADLRSEDQELEASFEGVELAPSLASRVAGKASASFERWDLASGTGKVELELSASEAQEGVPLAGRVVLHLEPGGRIRVDAPALKGPGVELSIEGELGETLHLDYRADVRDVGLLSARFADVPLQGSINIVGTIEGPWNVPRSEMSIVSHGLLFAGVRFDVDGALRWAPGRIRVDALTFRRGTGGMLTFRGGVDLLTATLSLRGEGQGFFFDGRPRFEVNLASMQVALEGPIRSLEGTISARLDRVRVRGVSLPDAQVEAVLDAGRVRLEAHSPRGDDLLEGNVATTAPYAFDVEVNLESLPIGALVQTLPGFEKTELELAGRLQGSGELSASSTFHYRLEAERVVGSYRGVGFGAGTPFIVEGNRETLSIRGLTLTGTDTAIDIEGTLPLAASGPVDLAVRGVARLELLNAFVSDVELAGRADLDVRWTGELPRPDVVGDVSISEGAARIGRVSIEGVDARIRALDSILTIDRLRGELLGGRFDVTGRVPLHQGDARVQLAFVDIDPLALAIDLADAGPEELRGAHARVSVSGELFGTVAEPSQWRGEGRFDRVSLGRRTAELVSEGVGSWQLERGRVFASGLRFRGLQGGETNLELEGEAEVRASDLSTLEWEARARGRLDLALLSSMLAERGARVSGIVDLDLKAHQASKPLRVSGHASVANARLSLREPAVTFTALNGELRIEDETLSLSRLEANVGGGRFTGSGRVLFSGASIREIELEGRADSVRISYPEGLRSEVSGQLRLTGAPTALLLTGDVDVTRGIFSRNFSLETELLQSLSQLSGWTPAEGEKHRIRLDMRIRTVDGLRIDNNLARLEASANLRLAGTLEEPELFGDVSIRPGGELRFGRNVSRIESARIELRGYPMEPPELDIQARTSVGDDDIRLSVRGPTDDLVTEFTGVSRVDQTALSRGDAMSLFLTGRKIDQVSTEGRAIVLEQMAAYAGSSLADLVQTGLGTILPFRIVTVEPALIQSEADPSARFTIGAALNDRLSVVYSIGLDDTEKQIWIVDYELPGRARTQLVRQEDNTFTTALSQQIQLDLRNRSRPPRQPSVALARVGFYFVSGEPEELEHEARDRLDLEAGERYDYWKAWEKTQRLRAWLRERGFLSATVDLDAVSRGTSSVALDVVVVTGKPVRFVWNGDPIEKATRQALSNAWDGYTTDAFLESDLARIAEGNLFEQRYYLSRVEVGIREEAEEITVSVNVRRGPRGRRVTVDFPGSEAIPDAVLLAVLPKRSSSEFYEWMTSKRPRLKQSLRVRCASMGYLRAVIGEPETRFDAATGTLLVAIPVEAGEPSIVESIELHGVEALDEREVRASLSLREGAPFRLTDFVKDRASLKTLYRSRGFLDVEVDQAVEPGLGPELLRARFVVREGASLKVKDITIVGNAATRESVIRRELALEPGAPLRLSDVNLTERRLAELRIFRSAEVVVTESGSGTGERDVVVHVVEAPDVSIDYGLRFTTNGLFEALGDVQAPNLFGRAHRGGFRALVGTNQRIFRFTYAVPYLGRYRVSTDIFMERKTRADSPNEDEDFVPFTDRTWTITAQQRRAFGNALSLQWSYSYKHVVTELEVPEGGFFDPRFTVNRAIVTGALIGDHRDRIVDPHRGVLWSVTAQGAPEALGSDLEFVKLFGQLFTFMPLGRNVVWASGFRVGAANSFGQRLAGDDRFQAGGPNTVRGFEQNTLGPVDPILRRPIGGAGVLIFNQEIRFPLLWRLGGTGFYDAGNVFETASDMSLRDLRQSAGLGVRFELPFGLLRFDWARVLDRREGEKPWRFIFSLGHAF